MTQSRQTEPEIQVAVKSKKRLWLWILPALLIVLAALLLSGIFLLTEPWKEIAPESLTAKDFKIQSKLLQKLNKEFFKKKIPPKSLLILSQDEVNALFSIAGNYKFKRLRVPIRYFKPTFDKGVFSLTIPYRLSDFKLKSRAIYVNFTFTLSKEPDKDLVVTLTSMSVNGSPMPESVLKKVQTKVDAAIEKSQKDIALAVEKISVEKGKLFIYYKPAALLGRRF